MKIQQEKIYTILSSDATLQGLLGAYTGDTKIYPMISEKFELFPCITYAIADSKFRTIPTKVQDIVIEFLIYSKDGKGSVEDIFTRLVYLLNYYQTVNTSIVYMKQIFEMDIPEKDRSLYVKVCRFNIWSKNN